MRERWPQTTALKSEQKKGNGCEAERSSRGGLMGAERVPTERPVEPSGDAYGAHRGVLPPGALPQQAWRVDNDFTRLFQGETLVGVETLNLDAASFAQMQEAARASGAGADDDAVSREVAHIVLRTITDRGKQHNPLTGSGGMLLGRVLQVGDGRGDSLRVGDRVASLVSLSLTPLRVDVVRAVGAASG